MAFNRRDVTNIIATPVATDGTYTTGQVIGAVLTLSSVAEDKGSAAELRSLVVKDKANAKGAIDLVFFDASPTNSIGADGATYALNDADLSKVIGRISVAAVDYISSSTNNAEATLRNIGLLLKAAAGQKDIYLAIIARDTIAISPADLSVQLHLERY